MICDAVRAWLMSAREEPLPSEVANHLRGCPDCAQFRRDLQILNRQATGIPPAQIPEPRLEALMASLSEQPANLPPAPPLPARGVSWLALAVTLVFSFGLGWFSGLWFQAGAEADSPAQINEPDLDALADLHVRLANTYDARGQVRLLELLASRLRENALKLARSQGVDYVPLLAVLHDQTLKSGLLRRITALDPAERKPVCERVQNDLMRAMEQIQAEAGQFPAELAELLEPFATSAVETSDLLQTGAELPPAPAIAALSTGAVSDLVTGLVGGTLELVHLTDPLQRAACSAAIAEQLALAVRLAQVRGDQPLLAVLEEALGSVVTAGMEPNLQRARIFDPDHPRLRELNESAARLARLLPPGFVSTPAALPGPVAPPRHEGKDHPDHHRGKGRGHLEKHEKRELRGILRTVDSTTRTVRVAIRDREQTIDMTYTLPPEVHVRHGGQELPLRELAPGMPIRLKLRDAFTIADFRLE